MILALSMIFGTSVVVFAESSIKEEYISDLRLIYADTYDEAKLVLSDSKLEGYKLLNNNLNSNSGKTGVWLAYKTTTNIDDAITDVAVMQMGGGYKVGNYQEMINNSRAEYEAMGQIYLDAIDYFVEAYDAENFLAKAAYRQLNFYAGLDKYKEERLGDLFVDGVLKKGDLATLFFEGNVKVTNNVRSLLAMGVSYNEDGMHYLEKVADSANKMNADPTVFKNENYKELAAIIATSIPVFRNMFEELAAYESELNYEDDEFTDLEIKYAEYKSVADRMKNVSYLGGKTLYEFCLEYNSSVSDYSNIYPLVDALNDGQKAMTKVFHYYDVVRYSMSDSPEELINSEISALEEKYAENCVDVFLGVDRSVYTGSFALTSDAYRADAYTESSSLTDALFGKGVIASTAIEIASGAVGIGLAVWAIVRSVKGSVGAQDAAEIAAVASGALKNEAEELAEDFLSMQADKLEEMRQICISNKVDNVAQFSDEVWGTMSYSGKIDTLLAESNVLSTKQMSELSQMTSDYGKGFHEGWKDAAEEVRSAASRNYWVATGVIYFLSAAALTYSAINLYNKIHDHYHPKYDEIPIAMVDLVKTVDGDRYIKYDVVLDTKFKDGVYHPADLNAFEGERWNAIYYTKSSEAGKPLLADFEVNDIDNHVDEGYSPVHRFGETVCYDLNKYNFSSKSDTIFLSIRQSENVKSDIAGVPDIVGAIFGTGFWALAGCAGIVMGVGGTLATTYFLNKKKSGEDADVENGGEEDTDT